MSGVEVVFRRIGIVVGGSVNMMNEGVVGEFCMTIDGMCWVGMWSLGILGLEFWDSKWKERLMSWLGISTLEYWSLEWKEWLRSWRLYNYIRIPAT
jgi:hypothetical protein